MTHSLVKTQMRFVFRADPVNTPDLMRTLDRDFIGVNEQDLHMQIKDFIGKYGMISAYNMRISDEETESHTSETITAEAHTTQSVSQGQDLQCNRVVGSCS